MGTSFELDSPLTSAFISPRIESANGHVLQLKRLARRLVSVVVAVRFRSQVVPNEVEPMNVFSGEDASILIRRYLCTFLFEDLIPWRVVSNVTELIFSYICILKY